LLLQAWLGIASEGFPDFEQFCIAGFPASTQGFLSPLRMPFRHARVAVRLPLRIIEQAAGICMRVCGETWRAAAYPCAKCVNRITADSCSSAGAVMQQWPAKLRRWRRNEHVFQDEKENGNF
jgi:hypothetical protein